MRNPAIHARIVESIRVFGIEEAGLEWLGVRESPLKGPAGNIEYLAYWKSRQLTG